MHSLRARLAIALVGAAALLPVALGLASAHVLEHAGAYTIALGWQHEPAYVGEQNAVQVIVTDAAGKPVSDLGAEDLAVTVAAGGQQSGSLTFESGFDAAMGLGTPGEYDASLMPTAIGDYTFHLTGSVHGTAVDATATSSSETFDSVTGTSDIQFPAKLPTMDEVVTRLDRIDARIATLTAGAVPSQAPGDATQASLTSAQQSADRALLVGSGVGLAGIVIGALGLIVAMRASRAGRAGRDGEA